MLPVGWVTRTNSSAPEGYVKAERPADWTALSIHTKYDMAALVDSSGRDTTPLGWGKRTNASTLEELSQSTSAAVIAVAEVHNKAAVPDGIFEGTSATPLARALETETETKWRSSEKRETRDSDEKEALKAQLDQMQQMLTLLSTVVVKMDAKLNSLEAQQQQILAAIQLQSNKA